MSTSEAIGFLEGAWAEDGFLRSLREGLFDTEEAEAFAAALNSIEPGKGPVLDRRLVELLWFLPTFLSWQVERVQTRTGNQRLLEDFINRVTTSLQSILGMP